jgi:hypothetical protein
MVDQNIHQSDIEVNPNRYILINGNDASTQNEQTGTLYEKDPKAYYPYDNPNIQRTVSTPRVNPEAKMRYGTNSVYQLDQKPYYGSNGDYRVIYDMPKDKLAVPIQFGDLTRTHADENNIKKLENELDNLNRGEDLNNVTLTGKYLKDSTAYYDPTLPEKRFKKAQLVETINEMKEALLHPNKPEFQTVLESKRYGPPKVQNYVNKNKEETNDFINRSYYYPIQKDANGFDVAGPIGTSEKQIVLNNGDVKFAEGRYPTLEALKADGSVIGAQPNNVRRPVPIIPPGEVLGTPVTEVVAAPKSNTAQSTRQTSTPSKYVVEADEKSKTFVEADSVGEVLGNKYVQEKNKVQNKSTLIQAESVDKKVVLSEVSKMTSVHDNREEAGAVSNVKNNESTPVNNKLNIKSDSATDSDQKPKGNIFNQSTKQILNNNKPFVKVNKPVNKPANELSAPAESSNISQSKNVQIKKEEPLKSESSKKTNEVKKSEPVKKTEEIKKSEPIKNVETKQPETVKKPEEKKNTQESVKSSESVKKVEEPKKNQTQQPAQKPEENKSSQQPIKKNENTKTEEAKKDQPKKAEVSKQESKTVELKSSNKPEEIKKEVKKGEVKSEPKKDENKSEVKKEENKTEVKKEQPKIENKTQPKIQENKTEVKKVEQKPEIKKEQPKAEQKPEIKKEQPKAEQKPEIKKEQPKAEQKPEIKKEKDDGESKPLKNKENKNQDKKDAPKQSEVKQEAPKSEGKKEEVKKEEPIKSGQKPEIKKEEAKKEEIKTQENKPKSNLRKEDQADEESRTENSDSSSESESKSSSEIVNKEPNTQGLKYEKVKIIPMRKLMNNNTEKSSEEKEDKDSAEAKEI